MQVDVLLPTSTVRESLMFHAALRLPRRMTHQQRVDRVNLVLSQLGLTGCAGTMVGDESRGLKGISGGEKRRLALGVELVHQPSIILLDEPSTGLDSATALQVIAHLSSLAKDHQRLVVLTIHQPSGSITNLFDDLLLMANGRSVYCGPWRSALGYFAHLGCQPPPHTGLAEWFMSLLGNTESDKDTAAEHDTVGTMEVAASMSRATNTTAGDDHANHCHVMCEDTILARSSNMAAAANGTELQLTSCHHDITRLLPTPGSTAAMTVLALTQAWAAHCKGDSSSATDGSVAVAVEEHHGILHHGISTTNGSSTATAQLQPQSAESQSAVCPLRLGATHAATCIYRCCTSSCCAHIRSSSSSSSSSVDSWPDVQLTPASSKFAATAVTDSLPADALVISVITDDAGSSSSHGSSSTSSSCHQQEELQAKLTGTACAVPSAFDAVNMLPDSSIVVDQPVKDRVSVLTEVVVLSGRSLTWWWRNPEMLMSGAHHADSAEPGYE